MSPAARQCRETSVEILRSAQNDIAREAENKNSPADAGLLILVQGSGLEIIF